MRLHLLLHHDEFLGFGEISVGSVPLRSAQTPVRVRISTPLGIEYSRFTLRALEGDSSEMRLRLTAHGQQNLHTELCDDYESDLLVPQVAGAPIEDELTWILRPARAEIGGETFAGFSYALEFASDARQIYRFTIEATWELGGDIAGVCHLHQAQCSPPLYRGARDTAFTTSVQKSLRGEGIENHSMQMNPRHGALQIFDYQYSPRGVLLGWWPRAQHIRSLIQKNRGETVLFVIDEQHVDYSSHVQSAPKEILFAPVKNELKARDLWKVAKDRAQQNWRAQWKIVASPIWTEAMLDMNALGNAPGAVCRWNGREIAPHEALRVFADEWLPQIEARGLEAAGFASFSQSDITEMGAACKRDSGIHGDLFVSSICNVWRYVPADYWGGMKAWKYFADAARERGIKVGVWVGSHISRNAPILREKPEWFNNGRTGKPNLGGYSSAMGATVNWNSGFRQWILEDLQRWRDEGGLDYAFLDSWSNLAALPLHYNADFSNNLDGLAHFISELQSLGFEHICAEGTAPFGVPHFGIGTHPTGAEGQNSLSWWNGKEDLADGLHPYILGFQEKSAQQARNACFRFMANRAIFTFEQLPDAQMDALYRVWPQVRAHMKGRETLPDGKGVLWRAEKKRVLFSYDAFEFEGGASVEQIYPVRKSLGDCAFRAEPMAIYKWEDEGE